MTLKNNAIGWSNKELQEWINAGLLDKELLQPRKRRELVEFITANKTALYNYYHDNEKELTHQIKLPQSLDLGNSEIYELQVIDRRTGKVSHTLDLVADIELVEGISLKIKSSELNEWNETAKKLKRLKKDDKKTFAQTFISVTKKTNGTISRKEIASIIKEIKKSKAQEEYRQSGHFVDQKLTQKKESLSPVIKEKLASNNIEVTTYGIKLTPSEDKMINSISKLLHYKSENRNQKSKYFYSGNAGTELIDYGNQQQEAPCLKVTLSELTKEYTGKRNPSGKEIDNTKKILRRLSEKKFLIKYERKRSTQNGDRFDIIEDVQSLIKIISGIEDMTQEEREMVNNGDKSIRKKKGFLLILISPLLTDQITCKYIKYPSDITERMKIAAGGSLEVTESMNHLRDYLLREFSNNRLSPQINETTLIKQLELSQPSREGRKSRTLKRINDAISVCKKIGLIQSVEIEIGSSKQRKYKFEINKYFK